VPIASIAEIVISEIAHSLMVRPYSDHPCRLKPFSKMETIAAILARTGERQVGEREHRLQGRPAATGGTLLIMLAGRNGIFR
jgi:hypothetical protein